MRLAARLGDERGKGWETSEGSEMSGQEQRRRGARGEGVWEEKRKERVGDLPPCIASSDSIQYRLHSSSPPLAGLALHTMI